MNTILAIITLLTSPALFVQQPQRAPMFHTKAQRVIVDVFVSLHGKPITHLTKNDFEIIDNGVRQHEVSLLRTSTQPISAVLLIDTSSSVRGAKLAQLKNAARTFISNLSSSDEIAIINFGTRYKLRQPLTNIKKKALETINTMLGRGATSLYDSLHAAIVHAETGMGRSLVVVFTDGTDNSSWLTNKDLLATAKASPTVIYAVRVGSNAGLFLGGEQRGEGKFIENSSDLRGRGLLNNIALAAGGRLISLKSAENLGAAFSDILYEMRSRYLLVYTPDASSPGWHTLEVKLKKPIEATVRTRAGYFLR